MEYVVGPVLALLLGLKFTDFRVKKVAKELERIDNLEERVIKLEERTDEVEVNMAKKMVTTVMPIAKAVTKLNQQVGIQWTSNVPRLLLLAQKSHLI